MIVRYTKHVYLEAMKCLKLGIQPPSFWVFEMMKLIQEHGHEVFEQHLEGMNNDQN